MTKRPRDLNQLANKSGADLSHPAPLLPWSFLANVSPSKLDAKNLAVPPDHFAGSGLIPLKKGQLKTIGNDRRRCCNDFSSVV
jgi:hypothetical protein